MHPHALWLLWLGYFHDTSLLCGVTQSCDSLENNYTWHEKPLESIVVTIYSSSLRQIWEKGLLSVEQGRRAER